MRGSGYQTPRPPKGPPKALEKLKALEALGHPHRPQSHPQSNPPPSIPPVFPPISPQSPLSLTPGSSSSSPLACASLPDYRRCGRGRQDQASVQTRKQEMETKTNVADLHPFANPDQIESWNHRMIESSNPRIPESSNHRIFASSNHRKSKIENLNPRDLPYPIPISGCAYTLHTYSSWNLVSLAACKSDISRHGSACNCYAVRRSTSFPLSSVNSVSESALLGIGD